MRKLLTLLIILFFSGCTEQDKTNICTQSYLENQATARSTLDDSANICAGLMPDYQAACYEAANNQYIIETLSNEKQFQCCQNPANCNTV